MAGGLHPPPKVIASWPTPNYVNPQTRDYGLIILCSVLGAFAILTVALRLWTRAKITRNFGIDDWVMIAAMPIVIGLTVAICLGSNVYYYNRHVWDVPLPNGVVQNRQITFVIELLYVWAVGPIKISILLFYKRLSHGIVPKTVVWTLWATVAFVVAYMITFTLTLVFSCRPVTAYWLQSDPFWAASNQYTCTNEAADLIAASVISAVQDFLVAGLPTVMFARMHIPLRQKLAMVLVFAVGFFLCITAIIRVVYIIRIFYSTYDVTWVAYESWCWTAVEVLMGVVVASVPALKIFIERHLDSVASNYGYGRSASTPSHPDQPQHPSSVRRFSKRITYQFADGGWAWNRTPSDAELAHPHALVEQQKDPALPLERVSEHSTRAGSEDPLTPPVKLTRSATVPDLPIGQHPVSGEDIHSRHARARSELDALKRHPTLSGGGHVGAFDPSAVRMHDGRRETWLSTGTSRYTASITASGSQSDGKQSFDPDAFALPILTEQETREMGLIGMAQ